MPATVGATIESVCAQFEGAVHFGHGTDNAWDEAVALVLSVAQMPDVTASLQKTLGEDHLERIHQLAKRRVIDRVPLAYLLGECAYMGLTFEVQPGVVVPRSPIGYLLSDGLQPWLPSSVKYVLDLCSGSGCLGIVAAHQFPLAKVEMVELDPLAAQLARRNIQKHGLQGRIAVHVGDVTVAREYADRFDLILCNPPYVDAVDMRTLPDEFKAEPSFGLAAGIDGLDVIAGVLHQLPEWLAPNGLFVGEVGASSPALMRTYPVLPFIWPELPLGGEGVFLLEGQAISSHTARGK